MFLIAFAPVSRTVSAASDAPDDAEAPAERAARPAEDAACDARARPRDADGRDPPDEARERPDEPDVLRPEPDERREPPDEPDELLPGLDERREPPDEPDELLPELDAPRVAPDERLEPPEDADALRDDPPDRPDALRVRPEDALEPDAELLRWERPRVLAPEREPLERELPDERRVGPPLALAALPDDPLRLERVADPRLADARELEFDASSAAALPRPFSLEPACLEPRSVVAAMSTSLTVFTRAPLTQ
jgi:hypothetical protein